MASVDVNALLGEKAESLKTTLGLGADKAMLYIQSSGSKLGTQKTASFAEAGKNVLNGLKTGMSDGAIKNAFNALKVQYNPATLQISANAESVAVRSHQTQIDDNVYVQNTRPPSVILSVELIFDDSDIYDCFFDKTIDLSIKSAATTLTNALAGKQSHSVQPQTSALIGMLMRENTRVVCFAWADMTFVGEVVAVDARYTMFNNSGEPVRSVVSLEIFQKVEETDTIAYWDDAFEKFFSAAGANAHVSANNVTNNIKGVVNVPFLK